MTQSLKSKTLHGVGWSALQSVLNYGISFVVGIVLARLLDPSEYGLIGMAFIFIALSQTIVDSGMSNSLIRKTDATDDDFQTVFSVNLSMSVLMYGVLYASAGLIADFFKEPRLVDIVRVLSVVVIVNAFAQIQRTILTKRIDFKSQTKVSLLAAIVSGVVGIGMAYMGYGVWALITQQLVQTIMRTVAFWTYTKWMPRLTFSKECFHEHFSFGWKLLVSGIISTGFREGTNAVIGRYYSAISLGYYTKAINLTRMFSTNMTEVVNRVTYPVLSEIQNDKMRLLSAYRRMIRTAMLPTFFCMLMLAAVAEPLVLTLIGEKWLPSVGMIQVLCFYLMLYPLHALNLNMLQVAGRSDLFLRLEVIKDSLLIVPLVLGATMGIYWMLWCNVLIGFIAYYLNAYYSGRFVGYSMWMQIKDIFPGFCVTVISAAVAWTITLLPLICYLRLVLQVALGIAILLCLCEILKLPEYIELKTIVTNKISKRTKTV